MRCVTIFLGLLAFAAAAPQYHFRKDAADFGAASTTAESGVAVSLRRAATRRLSTHATIPSGFYQGGPVMTQPSEFLVCVCFILLLS